MSASRTPAPAPVRPLAAAIAATLLAAALPAVAAEESADVAGEVVVTGSRILRPGFDTVQPAVVIDAAAFENRGFTNVADALNELPAFGPPGNSPVGGQAGFGVGQNFVNLFSLGSQRTLTLVNGRRFVSSNTASLFGPTDPGNQVDLNAIPTKLIERIDTIAVGGAPIYGSDAIAGTVNVVLRRDYEGVEVDVQGSSTELGDGTGYRVRGLAGTNFAGGRGNVVFSYEHEDSDGLKATARERTGAGSGFFTPADDSPYQNVLVANGRVRLVNPNGIPLVDDFITDFFGTPVSIMTNAQGQPVQFDSSGNLVPYDFGTPTGSIVWSDGGDGLNLDSVTPLLTDSRRDLGTVFASFQLTERTRAFAELWASRSRATRTADQPVYNTFLFGDADSPDGNIRLGVDNPFLTAQARGIINSNLDFDEDGLADLNYDSDGDGEADQAVFYLTRANRDFASGVAETQVDVRRVVAGVAGSFDAGTREINWEVSANYGRSVGLSAEPALVEQNFRNAIDAIVAPGGTTPSCRPGVVNSPIATLSSTCAPINLFGEGSPSQAARDYITTIARTRSVLTQRVVTANLEGKVLTLPGGDVSAVLGYENRRETSSFTPDTFFATGAGRSVPIAGVAGEFKTDEVFSELLVPIIGESQAIPFVRELQFEGAARWVDHSIAGSDLTWTAGLRFSPVEDVQFRANFTQAIRSPAVTEAFLPTSGQFVSGSDPCDADNLGNGPNPATRQANCAAAGIPADLQSNYDEFTIQGSTSGNPNLRNEQADSWAVGVTLRPRWVPNLQVAVDWIHISLKDAITDLDSDTVLNACYDSPNYPNEASCSRITRDPAGQLTFIESGFDNAGQFEFSGLTAQVLYRIDLPEALAVNGNAGTLDLRANFYYIDKLFTSVTGGDLDTDRGELGNAVRQGTFTALYTNRGFNASLQGRWTGSSVWDADAAPDAYDIPGVGNWWVFDASVGYDFTDKVSARLVVDNIADKAAPFPVPANGGTATYFSGILGRSYSLGVNVKF